VKEFLRLIKKIDGGDIPMKNSKPVALILSALMLVLAFAPYALAEADHGESITILIDRAVKPQSYFHIGRFFQKGRKKTVEVYEPVIRNYDGKPIESLTIQTASGRTQIPIETVQEIKLENWIERRTDDIPHIEQVVEAKILLTSGEQKKVLMNADFGTIEGKTERGEFFLADPITVRCIAFHRTQEEG
jgi:hypothetical protein